MTVTQWADKYRLLSPENSSEPGRWRTSRTPYLQEPMDAFTDPKIHRIIVVASSQVGKTEMELNMLGYAIDRAPGPIMLVLPTVDNAKDFSKRRLEKMIRDTAPLNQKIRHRVGNKKQSELKKSYPGGMLTVTGSNSPTNLASVPARYIFGDEIDRWSKDAGGEGSPAGLLEARTSTFYDYKMVMVSTPTTKDASEIEKNFKLGTQEYWCSQCMYCGEDVFIEFDDIKFDYHKTETDGEAQYIVDDVRFQCPHCGQISTEDEIRQAPHKWVAKNPEAESNGIRSFWINAFSSPWISWRKIVTRFLEAQSDPQKLKTVFNTMFGQLWEDRGDLRSDEELLRTREIYDAELPDGVLCLTCGVDTQDDRLEYEVVGYGMYNESWGIERGIIVGNPGLPSTKEMQSVWERLDAVIDKEWEYKDGKKLKISLTFVDSGGHYTNEVYEQCERRFNKRVFAIKGAKEADAPYTGRPKKVDIIKQDKAGNRIVAGKAWLYYIGVSSGKARIMDYLKVKEAGANYCHFPANDGRGYDQSYFNGLLSEKLTLVGNKWQWKVLPGHKRNEPLDCRNYANAAVHVLKPNMEQLFKKRFEKPGVAPVQHKPKFKKQRKREII